MHEIASTFLMFNYFCNLNSNMLLFLHHLLGLLELISELLWTRRCSVHTNAVQNITDRTVSTNCPIKHYSH